MASDEIPNSPQHTEGKQRYCVVATQPPDRRPSESVQYDDLQLLIHDRLLIHLRKVDAIRNRSSQEFAQWLPAVAQSKFQQAIFFASCSQHPSNSLIVLSITRNRVSSKFITRLCSELPFHHAPDENSCEISSPSWIQPGGYPQSNALVRCNHHVLPRSEPGFLVSIHQYDICIGVNIDQLLLQMKQSACLSLLQSGQSLCRKIPDPSEGNLQMDCCDIWFRMPQAKGKNAHVPSLGIHGMSCN